MANTPADVDRLLEEGANAIEVDVRFGTDGNAVRVYHGFPCDCFLDCEGEAPFTEHLEYIRSATSVAGGKHHNKLGLLFLDLKTEDISGDSLHQAGVDIVRKLVQHLWRDIPVSSAVNVLLYVNGVTYKDFFKGALEAMDDLPDSENWKLRLGFDFGPFLSLSDVGEAFADLNIHAHRWQGDGASNCIEDLFGSLLISSIVDCRDGQSQTCDYVDKAYVWNLDKSHTIEKMIK
ncbi:dermonecrotic toxin SPH-like [Amblyomma americanum]